MRYISTAAAVLIFSSVMCLVFVDRTNAGPLSSMGSLSVSNPALEKVGWRERYYRRHGVWPKASRRVWPRASRGVIENSDGVVVIVPARPGSCGEYHYWNGVACVDARYTD